MVLTFKQYLIEYNSNKPDKEEEEEPKMPGIHDRARMSQNRPDDTGERSPSIKRLGQRANRRLRNQRGTGNPAKHAEGHLDSIYHR